MRSHGCLNSRLRAWSETGCQVYCLSRCVMNVFLASCTTCECAQIRGFARCDAKKARAAPHFALSHSPPCGGHARLRREFVIGSPDPLAGRRYILFLSKMVPSSVRIVKERSRCDEFSLRLSFTTVPFWPHLWPPAYITSGGSLM